MKNLDKHVTTVALVATGVFVAGLAMASFGNIGLVSTARSGFRG